MLKHEGGKGEDNAYSVVASSRRSVSWETGLEASLPLLLRVLDFAEAISMCTSRLTDEKHFIQSASDAADYIQVEAQSKRPVILIERFGLETWTVL